MSQQVTYALLKACFNEEVFATSLDINKNARWWRTIFPFTALKLFSPAVRTRRGLAKFFIIYDVAAKATQLSPTITLIVVFLSLDYMHFKADKCLCHLSTTH